MAWSWKNGRLDTISNGAFANGKSYSFTYDGYGRLKQKQYNYFPGLGVLKDYLSKKTTTYTYDSSGRLVYEYRLLQYSDNTSTYRKFTYLYDESGIVGVVYNNNGEEQTYHYNRNIKGDVIGIFDVNGAEIVKYSYDSWGNFEITTGSLTNIAKDNPILYRGYYYDHDTELYLLDARFYNPKWRRFISPDDTAYLDPETPNGLNLYAYCNNDPVNYSDPSGNSAILSAVIIGALIGGATSFAFALGAELIHENWNLDPEDWWQIGVSTVIGAVEGALLILYPGSSMIILASASALDTAIYEAIDGSDFGTIAIKSLFSFILGAAAGADSSDFIKTRNSLIEMFDAKNISKSTKIRPKLRKIGEKTYRKIRNRLRRSTLRSLVDDFIYEFLNFITDGWTDLQLG